jgi:phosphatidylinositol dimannoside acyltransferase
MASRALRAYQVGAAVSRAVPAPVAGALATVGGTVAAAVAGDRRRQVERNLRRVHGPELGGTALRRAVVETFISYARYYVESFRLPGTPPEVLAAGFRYDGWEEVLRARDASGTGAIVALPHLGPWEWAGFWAAAVLGQPITVVVEALEPEDLYEWFRELREGFGLNVVALGPHAGAEVIKALRSNHLLVLLSDRDIGGGGVEVEFFGERTTLPAGPATLALRTGAPLFPSAVYAEDGGRVGVFRPQLDTSRQGRLRDDVQRVTQALANELEALIRRAPEQWHLLQPNWPSDREQTAPS